MVRFVEKIKTLTHLRTYQVEMLFVLIILCLIGFISKKGTVEWIGVIAVFLNFGYISVANRLREQEEIRVEAKTKPLVVCYKKLDQYYVGKELLWFTYFYFLGAWSAIAGIILFLLYRPWRKVWRKYHTKNGV